MSSVHIPRVLAGRSRTAVDTERENFEKAQVLYGLYEVGVDGWQTESSTVPAAPPIKYFLDVDVDVDVEEIRAQTNNCLYARS